MVLCLATFWVAVMGVAQANLIAGSLPLAGIQDSENGTTLLSSTILSDVHTITSGLGTGDFSVIPVMTTDFGPFSLSLSALSSGGGFSLFNATYGGFVANSGSLTFVKPNFLNVDLFGTYTPGPGIPGGVTAAPAELHLSFTQTGQSVSASMTLATVPEPGTMLLLGSAILGFASLLRHKRLE